jgi:hypothetical protein
VPDTITTSLVWGPVPRYGPEEWYLTRMRDKAAAEGYAVLVEFVEDTITVSAHRTDPVRLAVPNPVRVA